jgi:hypothetical protein
LATEGIAENYKNTLRQKTQASNLAQKVKSDILTFHFKTRKSNHNIVNHKPNDGIACLDAIGSMITQT